MSVQCHTYSVYIEVKIQQKNDVATIARAYWLVEYHKKILDLTVGAPGSTNHAHCLSNRGYKKKEKLGKVYQIKSLI